MLAVALGTTVAALRLAGMLDERRRRLAWLDRLAANTRHDRLNRAIVDNNQPRRVSSPHADHSRAL